MKSELWIRCTCGKEAPMITYENGAVDISFKAEPDMKPGDRIGEVIFKCSCGKEFALFGVAAA